MRLIFLHIPKAGGTTLHSVLERLYDGSTIFNIKVRGHHLGVEEFTSLSQEQKDRIQLLKGHMPFGLHTHFTSSDVKYITLFRNPVERIISHYEYVWRKPNHYLYDKVKNSNMTLLDYALSDLSPELDNHQCRSLLMDENIPIGGVNESLYNQAIKNLQTHFISFGLVEEFDKSLLLFRQALAWPEYPYYVKLNTKPDYQKKEIAQDVLEKIKQRNVWDMRLYQWVKDEFDRRLQQLPDLAGQLNTLKIASKAYEEGIDVGMAMAAKNAKRTGIRFLLSKWLGRVKK